MTTRRHNDTTRNGKIENRKSKIEIFLNRCFVRKNGFTIVELLMATMILSILITASASIYSSFYNSVRNIKAANLVYDETRFTLERIAKEIRSGTVDYEEYYNQETNFTGSEELRNETYGQNYCQYSQQFYKAGPDGQYGTYDDESTGLRKEGADAPLSTVIQDKLYLISVDGTKRTYIQRVVREVDGEKLGKVAMLKLEGFDYGLDHIKSEDGGPFCDRDTGEKDSLIDTWFCEKGFNCDSSNETVGNCTGPVYTIFDDPSNFESSFVNITPDTLDVTDLKFFITPADDPHKAYADPNVQIQPHITMRLSVQANKKLTSGFQGGTPNIVLETTVSSRAYSEIITECNLQECIDGDFRDCPKTGDVAGGAQVTCSQGVWPPCTDALYEAQALLNIYDLYIALEPRASGAYDGFDHDPVFASDPNGKRTFYEINTEFESCIGDSNEDNCKQRRCSDGFDNDGNGQIDEKDPICLFELCNNGHLDPGEDCIDVGGTCYFRQKKPEIGVLCIDGYDNDCDYDPNTETGGADQFDQQCIDDYICSNGIQDNKFLKSAYAPKNYLLGAEAGDEDTALDEGCIDIGGICDSATSGTQDKKDNENDSTLCYDGWDNDCDYDSVSKTGGADEFDTECKNIICSNGTKDCDLAPVGYIKPDWLLGYTFSCLDLYDTNDEKCIDLEGLCGPAPASETICDDGLDDNCNGKIDEADTDCCPDVDGDGYSPANGGLCTITPADCIDSEPKAYPGNLEECDGIDNNCNGNTDEGVKTTFYRDSDGDNYGNASSSTQDCSVPSGYVPDNTDCNDTKANAYPGATEVCDGIDNDCDSTIDEGCP